ncbi:RHS repeat-associated core domain-containing protein [Pseudomonas mosselii]|uniref:RHS repeat-associated core domain-containing protein n=1 Tax=Pseudomonas mosselii TaxID=78327 RepID=A0AA42RS26_9PSED|nr:RHS repeat-associated core domain-containing protein [Pseudomonas mosselii]MDH1629004.1 RHS repeat-associated core domain-containing protein [Pseudomonas mosselii]
MALTHLLIIDELRNPIAARRACGWVAVAYSPYGYRATSADFTQIGFTGQRCESPQGFYVLGMGYRIYSPVLMRFISADVLSPFGRGGVNAYAYCEGDPVNWQDSSGKSPSRKSSLGYHSGYESDSSVGSNFSAGKEVIGTPGEAWKKLGQLIKDKQLIVSYLNDLDTSIQKTEHIITSQRSSRGEPHSRENLERLKELPALIIQRSKYSDVLYRVEREVERRKFELTDNANAIRDVREFYKVNNNDFLSDEQWRERSGTL